MDKLSNLQEHLTEFARMQMHNTRSPMAGLNLLVRVGKMCKTDAERLELWDNILEGIEQLNQSVEDQSALLDLVRKLEEEVVSIELEEHYRQIALSVQAQRGVDFTLELKLSCQQLRYYPTLFKLLLEQMIDNAVKFRNPDRPLELRFEAEQQKDWVQLRFSDNGLGIDTTAYGDQLFKLYKSYHPKLTDKLRPTGLFRAKHAVCLSGGRLILESEVGAGSSFTALLPIL